MSSKIGLCLCGGGVTGAMYQVGCLAAVEDCVASFQASGFDVFVGTASGATVAMALASGISVQRMYRSLLDPADDFFPLQRNHLLRFDLAEMVRGLGSAVAATRRVLSSAASSPFDVKLWNELERFVDSLPAGIFSLDPYERFLTEFMQRRGIENRFSAMEKPLLIVAGDLDAGRRAVFGEGDLAEVPLSKAIVAASAIPVLFAPVRVGDRDYVDGGMGDSAHVDLAAERGCDMVVVVNPMVPVHAGNGTFAVPTGHGQKARVRDKGAIWVFNQAMRMRMESRLATGLENFREHHPGTTVHVLEPLQQDATLFMYSPMNFAARRAILQEGYSATVRLLSQPDNPLRRAFEARGLTVTA